MTAPIPPVLKYSVVHNFNSPPILIKFDMYENSLFVKFFTFKHNML